jgi:magnesium-transporting ATPase (P-type)
MKQGESNQDKSSEMARKEALRRVQRRIEEYRLARIKQRMEEDAKSPSGRVEPGFSMSDFVKGFLLTAVPAIALSVWSSVGYYASSNRVNPLYQSTTDQWNAVLLWLLGALLFLVTMIIGLRGSAFRTRGGRAGVLAGIAVAVVSLGVSCFALSTM